MTRSHASDEAKNTAPAAVPSIAAWANRTPSVASASRPTDTGAAHHWLAGGKAAAMATAAATARTAREGMLGSRATPLGRGCSGTGAVNGIQRPDAGVDGVGTLRMVEGLAAERVNAQGTGGSGVQVVGVAFGVHEDH